MDAVKFELGQIVYRKIDPDEPLQVTGIMFRPNGYVFFCTKQDGAEQSFYECELIVERTFKDGCE